jgi:hypothetical protein
MKASDLLRDHEEPQTIEERLRTGAELGISKLTKIERLLNDLHKSGQVQALRLTAMARMPDPIEMRVIEHSLVRGLSPSTPGFGYQLTMIGEKAHTRIAEDPANMHLYQNLIQLTYMHATWAKYGLNVFNLMGNLLAGLILTDPLPLTEENFQLPFPCFAITLPPNYIPFSYRHDEPQWTQLIWVHRFKSTEVEDRYIYQVTAESNGVQLYWREPLERLNRTKCDSVHAVFEDDPAMTQEDDVTMTAVMRVVRNLVTWINSVGLPKAEVQKAQKKKNTHKNVPKDRTVPTTWLLGREVKFGPEIRQSAKDAVQSLDKRRAPKDWKVKVQYLVRGHWRNQAHGPGRSERRRQWINPFWKGPEGAAAFAHMYEPRDIKPEET